MHASARLQANSLLGLLASSELEVCHGIYCCFDAFTKEDVRCVMASPGGVRAYATDASGRKCASLACVPCARRRRRQARSES